MLFVDEQVVLQVPLAVIEANNAVVIATLSAAFLSTALVVMMIIDMAVLKASGTLLINNLRQIFTN